jgi:acyl dehydratase
VIDYHALKAWDFGEVRQAYSRRDTILYALGIGLGAEPLDAGHLRFVYGPQLQALPTMAAVLAMPRSGWSNPLVGANYLKLVHGEQHLRLFKPLPVEATARARDRVVSLTDLGAAKGAIATTARQIFDDENGELLAEATSVLFLRGDGGFSERSGVSDPRPKGLPAPPDCEPDIQIELASLPQTALIYRLSGDYNPLHADPEVARAAGFPRPILHGLCSFGMAAHAVLKTCCEYQADRIRSIAVRFTAPVFPGETLRFCIWHGDPKTTLHFRASVASRDKVVLDHGVVELSPREPV